MLKTLLVITSLLLTIGVNAQQRNTGVRNNVTRTTTKTNQVKNYQVRNAVRNIPAKSTVANIPAKSSVTAANSSAVSVKPMSALDSGYPYEPDSLGYIVRVGQKAPDFTLTRLDDKTFSLSKNRGKVVLLQFTASWCGVCRTAMKEALEPKLWKKLKRNPNFVMLGIDSDEPVESVGKFVRDTGITYPMGLDPDAEVYEKYAAKGSGVTRNVLIGKNGRIVKLTRLYDEKEFDALVRAVRAELAK